MEGKSQDYLRLALAAAVLLIGLSVAYHYVIYIPQRDHEKELDAKATADAASKQSQATAAAAEKMAAERQTNYRICLSNAQHSYDQRWEASCKRLSDLADRNRAQCVQSGGTVDSCVASYPSLPASGCGLPASMSQGYDAGLKDDQKRCLDEAQAGVLTGQN